MVTLKELIYRLFTYPYQVVFKEHMSETAHRLFVGTSYAAVGVVFGALLTFIFTILGARILGPENFGNYSLVTSVGVIVGVSMTFSVTSTLKYASEVREDQLRTRIISTSTVQVVLFVMASVIIYVLFSTPLSQAFGISDTLFLFGVLYAVSITFLVMMENTLRILFRMKTYALLTAVQSIIVLSVFLLFVSADLKSWQYAAYAVFVANFVVSAVLVVHLRKYVKLEYDRVWAKKILKYSFFSAPGAIALAFMGVDKILVNAFQSTASVGVYSAYFLPSLSVATLLWGIVNATFFPHASRSTNRLALFSSVNRAMPYMMVTFVPLIVFVETIAFVFYGSQYPFKLELSLVFALGAACFVLFQCYGALMASEGTSGVKVWALSNILALAVLISVNVALLPPLGILGAAIALVFTYLIPTLYLGSKRHVLSGTENKD